MDLVEGLLVLDSSTARAINRGPIWGVGDYLTADVFAALSGKDHPARPKAHGPMREFDPDRAKAKQAALERKRQREADIAAGRIT